MERNNREKKKELLREVEVSTAEATALFFGEKTEQELEVYRACATGKADRESFLNSYEENGFQISMNGEETDPQEYSLSTYIKFRDVKRFMTMDSHYGIPFVIAKGITKPIHGICLETKEWRKKQGLKYRGSHVDWWLYEGAEPWTEFKEVTEREC